MTSLRAILLGSLLFTAIVHAEKRIPPAPAEDRSFPVTISSEHDLKNVLVTIPVPPSPGKEIATATASLDGKPLSAQLTEARLLSSAPGSTEVVVLVPALKANMPITLKVTIGGSAVEKAPFAWKEVEGKPVLEKDGKPLLLYFHTPFDPNAMPKEMGNPTMKPYHHLYASDGKTLLTNGPEGIYPHHRGIFFGFNNISYDGKTADVWHGKKGAHQSHDKVILQEAGPLLGRQRVAISWHGGDDKTFANEERELTVYNLTGGTLIEFESVLKTDLVKVRLDGDPQHAGFHFRACQDVEKNKEETYFLRPDGKGEKNKEINWDPKTKKGPVNLPWDAMSFMVGGKRYTVVYLDNPHNPKESRSSERTYGRIGSYFEFDLTKDKPLKIDYRLWVQPGEVTAEECEALSKSFAEPVKVVVK